MGTHLCMKMQSSDRPGSAPRGPSHQRWRHDALKPPEVLQGQPTDLLPHRKPPGNRSKITSGGWLKKRHYVPPGNAWERRVPTRSSSTSYPVSKVWYFRFRQRKRWRIGYFYSQEPPARPCECHSRDHLPKAPHRNHKIWWERLGDRQRPF